MIGLREVRLLTPEPGVACPLAPHRIREGVTLQHALSKHCQAAIRHRQRGGVLDRRIADRRWQDVVAIKALWARIYPGSQEEC